MRRDWGRRLLLAFLVLVTGRAMAQSPPASQAAVVRAVLFFAPTCPHCHKVMTLDLPPIQQRFGRALRIVTVDVTTVSGQSLYQATAAHFAIPPERTGVPTLVVGNNVLVGDEEIPVLLPDIVARGLAAGGIDWPNVPALRAAMASADTAQLAAPRAPTMKERFLIDPVGNGAAVVVLALMLIALAVVAVEMKAGVVRLPIMPTWVVPVLALIGLAVASYLTFVEVSGTRAICGPVGDCNTVQNSSYAKLFGVLHVGLLGVSAYMAMLGTWVISRARRAYVAQLGTRATWLIALGGTLFSVYLTFLEPFVIGATCAWCLASALVITLLMLVLTPAARRARYT